MGIRIDALDAAYAATRGHEIPAMKDNVTVKLTVGQILDLILGSAPGQLDTLEELAAALSNDAHFAATITAALASKASAADTNINALTAKTTPLDADEMRIADSAASFGFKKLTFSNLRAWILAMIGSQVITPWVAYTPTFTGFGTVSGVSIWSRRVGDTLQIRGKFTAGTSTAVEARMTLGFNGTNGGITSDNAKVPSIQLSGNLALSVASAVAGYTFVEGNVGYITFAVQGASNASLTKVIGSAFGSSLTFSLTADIPISGW